MYITHNDIAVEIKAPFKLHYPPLLPRTPQNKLPSHITTLLKTRSLPGCIMPVFRPHHRMDFHRALHCLHDQLLDFGRLLLDRICGDIHVLDLGGQQAHDFVQVPCVLDQGSLVDLQISNPLHCPAHTVARTLTVTGLEVSPGDLYSEELLGGCHEVEHCFVPVLAGGRVSEKVNPPQSGQFHLQVADQSLHHGIHHVGVVAFVCRTEGI